MHIYPSILTIDFSKLEEQIKDAVRGGADGIHVDVMDGQFVPPITFGTPIIQALHSLTDLPLDIHMMVVNPDRFLEDFVTAGATSITVHYEAVDRVDNTLDKIADLGVKTSLALNPETTIEKSYPYLHRLDQILLMSVKPGYGGQSFIKSSLDKIHQLKNKITNEGLETVIQVDGGVNLKTITSVAQAGADIVVAGSVVFQPEVKPSESLKLLKDKTRSNN